MSRQSAARTTARLAALKPTQRTKMGICPVCDTAIYDNQDTAWRSVDGKTARTHAICGKADQ